MFAHDSAKVASSVVGFCCNF